MSTVENNYKCRKQISAKVVPEQTDITQLLVRTLAALLTRHCLQVGRHSMTGYLTGCRHSGSAGCSPLAPKVLKECCC